ncbi:MAG: site-specific DNA-methyltransferase [Firmicutes bacterium]|nr:site-specific DNA-methyltransferase [Bacillota bacterium]
MTKNRIEALLAALEDGRAQYERLMAEDEAPAERREGGPHPAFAAEEVYDLRQPEEETIGSDGEQMDFFSMAGSGLVRTEAPGEMNRIAAGDNLDYMLWLLKEKHLAGKIQLIYVDPPFFSNAKYQSSVQITGSDGRKSPVLKVGAYEDTWGHDLKAYLEMLAVRFFLMRDLLSETGSLWVHLDWHGSHYVKMMLDEIFGANRFVNEVVWVYKSGGASKHSFSRKHDTLLFYSRTENYKFRPLQEKSYNREGKPYRFKGVEEFQDEHGWYTMVNMKDVWNIDMVGRTSAERKGYATQKPEKLLQRIVESCTDEGDLCADFFAGTGTLGAVCAETNRRWILCDTGDAAIGSQILRMAEKKSAFLVERPRGVREVGPKAYVQAAVKDGRAELQGYQPDLTQVQQRDREIVSGYINENSLDLISFWSVDPEYDGCVHSCRRILHHASDAQRIEGAGAGHAVSIVGYDLFGGRFAWVQEEVTDED